MSSIRDRLVPCFLAVFPHRTAEELEAVTVDTEAAWDSSNHFTLVQLVEEAFGITIPEEAVGEIDSFAAMERFLKREGNAPV